MSHRPEPLRAALKEIFGERVLGESKKRLVIPSYSLDVDDVYVFKTPHHPRLRRDGSELMVEVGMATAAAPTFLPVFKLRTRPPGFSTRVISRVHRATRA